MRYAFIKCEDLSSAAFRGAEPVDRATWLCLLAWCYEHENGGRIVGAKAWGDRRWQQTVAVMLKEVQREAPGLWSWDGDDLVVGFYDHVYVAQVQSDSRQGTAGGRASSPAKAAAARANARKRWQAEDANTDANTDANEMPNACQHDMPKNASDAKPVCQSVSLSVCQSGNTAAATPPPREQPQPGLFDRSPAQPPMSPPAMQKSWMDWRLEIGRHRVYLDREGNAEAHWAELYHRTGWDEFTKAWEYCAARTTKPDGKVFLSNMLEVIK